jgi:hypothetical protein
MLPAAVPPPPPPVPSLIGKGKVRFKKARRGRLQVDLGRAVACPAAGASCTALVTLTTQVKPGRGHRKAPVTLVRAAFTIRAGGRTELILALPSGVTRTLRHSGRLPISEQIVLRDGAGPIVVRTGSALLRRP